MLDEAEERAARVRRALRGQRRRARRRRARRGHGRAQAIVELVGRAGTYAILRFAVDTADPANGALLARVQERATGGRDEAAVLRARVGRARRRARRRAAERRRAGHDPPPPAHDPPLPPAPPLRARGEAHDREGGHRPRRVDAPVLRADERDPGASSPTPTRACRSTSRSAAWCRPTASCAARTAEAVTAALEPGLRTRAYVFNTLLPDKATDDRLRAYPNWISSRNLANEASDESVQALVEAVRSNYDLPQRWYRLKAELLGVDRLADYDRMASVATRRPRSSGPRRARSCSPPSTSSRPCSATSPSASSTSTGSTRPCARASAAARSAPTRARACTPT